MTIGRMLGFLGVLVTLTGLLHYYLWARLVRDTALPLPWARIATGLLVALALSMPAAFLSMRFGPRPLVSAVSWIAFTWMGLVFLFFVLLVVSDVGWLVAFVARRGAALDPERRALLGRIVGGAVSVVAAGVGGVAMAQALGDVAVKRVRVPLAKLPRALDGYRIVQLTDIHVGPTIGRDFIEGLVRKSNALDPDLVVITGDLVDGSVSDLARSVEPLRDLRAKDGVFFVTGNHEYYSGVADWIAHLPSLGIRVLANERVAIRGETGFDLAGTHDFRGVDFGDTHKEDLAAALAGRDASRALVLLAHQPKTAPEAARHGVCLQLSGHTHGGQIFPFTYLVRIDQPFVAGLHKLDGTWIYVSCGTGYWGPPMRLAAPAEITHLELVSEA